MQFRFDSFELDTRRRELRREGHACPVQPQVFAVLEYLVRHRDRVVPKAELLDRLWPGVVVSDASLQRAVSLARSAIGDDGRRIKTVPRHGYRFVADVHESAALPAAPFRPRFATSGNVHIAYHVLGEGEFDIVIVPGWVFPMRAFFDHPEIESWLRGMTQFGRVVLFDKRGTGLSDRVKTLPTLDQRADDLRAVLDAAGSHAAIVVGISEGGPLALLYATSFPERVRGLLIAGAFARWAAAPDYSQGWPAEAFETLRQYIAAGWGGGYTIRAIVESRSEDGTIAAWAGRAEQEGASPGAALDLLEMNLKVDVRPLLPTVAVPTVVLHSRNDAVISVENARYLASHIPGARLIEVPGRDHAFFFEGVDALREALDWLARQTPPPATHFLATVLAVSADAASAPAVLQPVATLHGAWPAGALAWRFDGPQRAIRCAHAMLAHLEGRCALGIHTGEVHSESGRLVGDGCDVAVAIAQNAQFGEVRVSQIVRDLVHGAPIAFSPRNDVRLADGRTIASFAAHAPPQDQQEIRNRKGR